MIPLGSFAGLKLSARKSVLIAYPGLAAGIGLAGGVWLSLAPFEALTLGVACALIHLFGEFWHNLGHAAAARSVGHPMIGITFWGLLAASIYPKDEGTLPARVHIWRALGGPLGSSVLTLLALAALYIANGVSPLLSAVTWFFFLDNLLVYSLGAFLPLGFTDGSTLLYWIKRL